MHIIWQCVNWLNKELCGFVVFFHFIFGCFLVCWCCIYQYGWYFDKHIDSALYFVNVCMYISVIIVILWSSVYGCSVEWKFYIKDLFFFQNVVDLVLCVQLPSGSLPFTLLLIIPFPDLCPFVSLFFALITAFYAQMFLWKPSFSVYSFIPTFTHSHTNILSNQKWATLTKQLCWWWSVNETAAATTTIMVAVAAAPANKMQCT